jgi:hypothetical protein
MAASEQQRKYDSRKISVWNCYLATPSEDKEAVMFGVVTCREGRTMKWL